jgi:glycogen synthase
MKILMNADTIGGVWTYAVQLITAMEPYGVEYVLCSTGLCPTDRQVMEVGRLSNVRLVESQFKLEWMEDPWQEVRAAGRWLQEIADCEKPDLVHLNDYSHAARDWQVPALVVGHSCVLSWHEAVHKSPAGSHWDNYRRNVTAGIRAADAVVAPSQAMLGMLQRHYGPLNQSEVIHNGMDLHASVEHNAKERQVLAAGRLWDDAKNISALVRAASQIECPVRLAGETGHSPSRPSAATNVDFLGRLSFDELVSQYRKAAIYALPAKYEPFGYTPLEAALFGCALVLGDIESLREVWLDAAIYVPPDDNVALASAVNSLLHDSELLRRQADSSRQRAATFTAAAMATEYLNLYRQLATSAAPKYLHGERCVL